MRLSIKAILISLFCLISLMLAGVCTKSLLDSHEKYASSDLVTRYAGTDKSLFDALLNFRSERGDSATALVLPPEKSEGSLKSVMDRRAKVITAMDKALSDLASFEAKRLQPVTARLKADYDAVQQLRAEFDAEIKKPVETRSKELSGKILSTGGKLLANLEQASSDVEGEIRNLDPSLAELIEIRVLAWATRAQGGAATLIINPAVSEKRTLQPKEINDLIVADGRTTFAWNIVRGITDQDREASILRDLAGKAQNAYFAGPFKEKRDAIIRDITSGGISSVTIDDWRVDVTAALTVIADVANAAMTLLNETATEHASDARQSFVAYSVLLILALALGISGFAIVQLRVTGPISALTENMRRLAAGELSIEVSGILRGDEIGSMAGAVQVFKDSMIHSRELEEEAKVAKVMAEADRKREMAQMADQFERAVGGIVTAVSDAATQLQSAAQALSSSSSETSHQSTIVAAASEQAAANVHTVAAAAEELSGSVREISRQVGASANIAQKAVQQAERTTAQVSGLSVGAQKIGAIVDLINDIASKTNLLALNATIEAARAGEAGRGFAVVASEVKALAEQTSKATAEITGHIGSVQSSTDEAANAILDIGRTIDEISHIASAISAAVEEQGTATEEIARNVDQAAQGTSEVTRNIAGVNQAAETSSASASQVLSSATELAEQSEKLRGEMRKFLATVRAA